MELCLVWCHFSKNKPLFLYFFGSLEFGKGKKRMGWDGINGIALRQAALGKEFSYYFFGYTKIYSTASRSRNGTMKANQIKSNHCIQIFVPFFYRG
jgi:hypothetical protein